MTRWGGAELDAEQRHWAGWRVRAKPKPIKANYYLASGIVAVALVIALL